MNKPIDEDLECWNIAAEEYDDIQKNTGDPNRIHIINPAIFQMLGNVENKRILDAGCGNGYLTSKLNEMGANVVGIDGSIGLIEKAQGKFPKEKFILADLNEGLPFEDQEFDVIVCPMVIQYLSDPSKALKEFQRIIKKDGEIIIVIPHPCFSYPSVITRRGIIGRIFKESLKMLVKNYSWNRRIKLHILGMKNEVSRYHRTLSAYWDIFEKADLSVTSICEPTSESVYTNTPKRRIPRQIFPLKNVPRDMVLKLRRNS